MIKTKKSFFIVLLIIILCLATFNFLYWAGQKEGVHCDETYTYGLSNYEDGFFFKTYEDSLGNIKWNTAEDIDQYLTVSKHSRFDYGAVYYNQINDVHPPLYYIIIHTISSFFTGSDSYYMGIIPNILFTLGTCILLYLIGFHIFKKRSLALLAVLFFAFSVNSVNMVIFIRMYALLTFFTSLVIYLHLCLDKRDYVYTKTLAILMFLTVFLGAYTQYYFLIFLFSVVLVECFILLIKKEYKKLFTHIGIMAFSGIVYLAVWPASISHIFKSGRGVEAFDNASNSSALKNAVNYIDIFKSSIGEAMIFIIIASLAICLIFFVVSAIKKKGIYLSFTKYHKNIFMCTFTVVLYFFMIAKVAPYQTDRYIAPVFPLICLLSALLMHKAVKLLFGIFLKKEFKYAGTVVFLLLAICLGANLKLNLYDFDASNRGHNYLYRMSDENRKNFEENNNKKCVMISTHESHFLFNFADYKKYNKIAFVSAGEIDKLQGESELEGEKEIIVYINDALDTDYIAKLLCETTGFDNYELYLHSNTRNWANVYKLTKNNR